MRTSFSEVIHYIPATTHSCLDCKEGFSSSVRNAKRCPSCRKIHDLALSRKRKAQAKARRVA